MYSRFSSPSSRGRATRISLLGLVLFSFILSGCISIPLSSHRSANLKTETLVEADHFYTTDSVLMVELNGELNDEPETGGFLSKPGNLVVLKDALKKAEKDPFIQAVLVRIDSPGGSVTASDLIYTELKRFKEHTKKKVVAVFMGTAASGGYYAAMAADYIVVHPTTVTGSIGVISMSPDLSGLAKLARVDMRVIKSGEHKDIGSMWREMDPAEREILQGIINTMYERFLKVVGEGRPKLSPEKIRQLADGRIYTGAQAVELGLADEEGYIEDAFKKARDLAGLKDAALVAYTQPGDYKGHYYAEGPAGTPTAGASQPGQSLLNIQLPSPTVSSGNGFYYLWRP